MFIYYNNNPLGREVNDCSVRAIALATEQSWDDTYKKLSDFAQKDGITFSEIEFIDDYLAQRYPRFCQNEKNKVITVKDFTDLKLPGRWLVTMSGHITAIIDGICYDTFNPEDRYMWCAYCVK